MGDQPLPVWRCLVNGCLYRVPAGSEAEALAVLRQILFPFPRGLRLEQERRGSALPLRGATPAAEAGTPPDAPR